MEAHAPAIPDDAISSSRRLRKWLFRGIIFAFFISSLVALAIGPVTNGIRQAKHNTVMQQTRTVGQLLFNYATDNTTGGNCYPDGKSSTEVFQKMIDENYVTDPEMFYIPMPGKVKPVSGQKLKPENVCFDLTSGVGSAPPGGLPLVYVTGYRVSYVPGGSAVPMSERAAEFAACPRSWAEWWRGEPIKRSQIASAIVTYYAGNNAAVLKIESDGTVHNFVSPGFRSDGKTYRQLTPDGVLP